MRDKLIEAAARAMCAADTKYGGDVDAVWEAESAVWLHEATAALDAILDGLIANGPDGLPDDLSRAGSGWYDDYENSFIAMLSTLRSKIGG